MVGVDVAVVAQTNCWADSTAVSPTGTRASLPRIEENSRNGNNIQNQGLHASTAASFVNYFRVAFIPPICQKHKISTITVNK